MVCRKQIARAAGTTGHATTTSTHNPDKRMRSFPLIPKKAISLCASTQGHDLDCLEHDQYIQCDRSVLDIEEVILQFFSGVCHGVPVLVAHLRPSGDSRPYHMANAIIGNFLGKPLDKLWSLGAWADKSHVAFQHAPQLRNLIESRASQKSSNPGDARVLISGPRRPGIGLGILTHGAKFIAIKRLARMADSPLCVKERARRVQHDRNSNQRNNRKRQQQRNERNREMQRAADKPEDGAEPEAGSEDNPARIELLHLNSSRDSF